MSAGVSRYPPGKTEKQADRRAKELPGLYRRPLQRLDQEYRGTGPGETGALVTRLQGYGSYSVMWPAPGLMDQNISMLSFRAVRRAEWTISSAQLAAKRWRGSSAS